MTLSVQIVPLRSTGWELTTVPSMMTGDFVTSCASVGMTMVVAETLPAISSIASTHVNQYSARDFTLGLLLRGFGWGAPLPEYTRADARTGQCRGGTWDESYSWQTTEAQDEFPGHRRQVARLLGCWVAGLLGCEVAGAEPGRSDQQPRKPAPRT